MYGFYGSKGKIYLHPKFHHTIQINLYKNSSVEILELPYQGIGYIHENDEVNTCFMAFMAGKTESDLLPLSTSLSLAEILDRVKACIHLEY